MALRRVDDLDGTTPVDAPTRFTFEGKQYELDLGPENLAKFREALAPYLGAAQVLNNAPTASAAKPASKPTTRRDASQTQAIRAWAISKGKAIGTKGRIPQEIIAEWEADKD